MGKVYSRQLEKNSSSRRAMRRKLCMSKVIVFELLTLDGVMQAPGRPDEDQRGGFEHGGWAVPYAAMEAADNNTANTSLLLGRRTYEDFYAVWPKRTGSSNTEVLNTTQKYVVSTTLSEPLPWSNSKLLKGDAIEAVARLKQELDKDLVVLGSRKLVQSLMQHHLIDEYVLLIHPLILGSGSRLFPEEQALAALRLIGVKTTPTGVVVATYQSAA
jgi:dihydrofolate reductase